MILYDMGGRGVGQNMMLYYLQSISECVVKIGVYYLTLPIEGGKLQCCFIFTFLNTLKDRISTLTSHD